MIALAPIPGWGVLAVDPLTGGLMAALVPIHGMRLRWAPCVGSLVLVVMASCNEKELVGASGISGSRFGLLAPLAPSGADGTVGRRCQ